MASMFFPFSILLCFFLHLPLRSFEFICPGSIYPQQGLSYARIESNISGRGNELYAKLRIRLFYDPSIDERLRGLVQEAADFWSNVLSVKPLDGRIFMSRDCESGNKTVSNVKYCLGSCKNVTQCIGIEIRKEHLDGCKYCTQGGHNCTKDEPEPGTGVENADLVFYASAISTKTCTNVNPVAYAAPCDIEPVLDRPVFAVINICPEEAEEYSNDNKQMLIIIKHEMMHPLGFSRHLFPLFRDKQGQPLNKDGDNANPKVLKTIERDWHVRGSVIKTNRTFLITPNVIREARAHFGCPDLEGAELENFGSEGTRKSHFEARIFYEDAMKGEMGIGRNLFSRLDFAVLEDSGWYQVNYSQAERMDFGRSLGCDFCMKSCKFWMDKRRKEGQSVEPYCDTFDYPKQEYYSCRGSNKVFSGCPLIKHGSDFLKTLHDPNSTEPFTELPRRYQNFDNISGVDDNEVPQYGFLDEITDFCPIKVEIRTPLENNTCDIKSAKDPNESEKDPNESEKEPLEKGKEPSEKETDSSVDEEYQKSNYSTHFGSYMYVRLVYLFAGIVVMLQRQF